MKRTSLFPDISLSFQVYGRQSRRTKMLHSRLLLRYSQIAMKASRGNTRLLPSCRMIEWKVIGGRDYSSPREMHSWNLHARREMPFKYFLMTHAPKRLLSMPHSSLEEKARLHEQLSTSASPLPQQSTAKMSPKMTLWDKVKHECKRYWVGSKLLWADMKISTRLAIRLTQGDSLSRREHQQLQRTIGDMFRLVPFSFFVIVPFAEFTLPIFLKLFPRMLPSTFEDALQKVNQ
jgi:hypothetical protein